MDAPDFEENTKTIRKWVNRQTVSTRALANELWMWAEYWESELADERKPT